jgi:hypothetical protein
MKLSRITLLTLVLVIGALAGACNSYSSPTEAQFEPFDQLAGPNANGTNCPPDWMVRQPPYPHCTGN